MAFHIGRTEERPTSKDTILPFPVTSTVHNVTAWGKKIKNKGCYQHQCGVTHTWFSLQLMV